VKYEMTFLQIVSFLKEKGYSFNVTSLSSCNIQGNFIKPIENVTKEKNIWSFDFDAFEKYMKSVSAPEGYISLTDACKKYGFSIQYLRYRRVKGDFKAEKFGPEFNKVFYAKESDIKKLSKRNYVHHNGKGE